MTMEDMLSLSALEQAALIRERDISSTELVRGYLDRIERLNPKLGAFVQVWPGRALRKAKWVDRWLGRKRNDRTPTFIGVPTGIKDTDPVRRSFNRIGSKAFRFLWTPTDGPAVKRVRKSGMVFLGKLNTSELALMPVVEPDIYPPARNPWNTEHSSGGSSGGSSAAVAAGLLPLAHAADGAGSIRIPGAFCHLFGFKPSRGLHPPFYAPFEPLGLSTVNALCHTVNDSAAMLDVLAGDALYPPGPTSLLSQCQKPLAGPLKVSVCVTSPLTDVDPQIAKGVMKVASLLEDMGHHIETVPTPEASLEDFLPIYQRQAANPPVWKESSLQPPTRWLREEGKRVTRDEAMRLKKILEERALGWFGDADIWLLPSVGCFAPKVHVWRDLSGKDAFMEAAKLGAFTAALNVTGQPAASVPAGFGSAGLPYGVQIAAKPGQDVLVLQVCKALEEAMPWRSQRPDMAI